MRAVQKLTPPKPKAPKSISFNKLSRTCGSHIQDDDKRCFCEETGANCREDICPILNTEPEPEPQWRGKGQ